MRHLPLQAPMLRHVYLCFWIAGIAATAWPWPAVFCALLIPVVDKRLRGRSRLLPAAVLMLTGFVFASWQIAAPEQVMLAAPSKHVPRLCGTVRDVRGMPSNRLRIFMDETLADNDALPGVTAWTWEQPLLHPLQGQRACVSQRIRPVHSFANEGLQDTVLQQRARDVAHEVWTMGERGAPHISGTPDWGAAQREKLRTIFTDILFSTENGDQTDPAFSQGKAILLALLFGDRRAISQQTANNFAAGTLAHSLALSGQHLAVVGIFGLVCVLAAGRIRASIYLAQPRAVWTILASCPPALFYLWLGNAPASLIRASCMLFVLAFWMTRRQARTTLDALGVALLCITALFPLSVLDTGLQLSALCVAIIGCAMPAIRRFPPLPESVRQPTCIKNFSNRCIRSTLQIFLLSLSLQTALLPINLLIFGAAGFWFPLNMIWLPIVGCIALPGAALGLTLAAFDIQNAARIVVDAAVLPCQWVVDMLVWLDSLNILQNPAVLRPHWTTLPAYAALLAALALKVNRPALPQAGKKLLAIGILLLCVGPLLRMVNRAGNDIRLSLLDVGQGQAVLLRFPDNMRLLLDGGGSISSRFDPGKHLVAPALTYNDTPRLAAVGVSHPDMDHLKGLLYLLENFSAALVFDNGQNGNGELGRHWETVRQAVGSRTLAENDTLQIGKAEWGLRLEVLHPPQAEQRAWARNNDASLVLRLIHKGKGLALLPGDIGVKAQQRLLDSGHDLRAQALVAPHHGSDKNFLPEFVASVQPNLILASCGFQNRYGFPGKKLTAWAKSRVISLLDTGNSGQITVTWPQNAPMRVTTANRE